MQAMNAKTECDERQMGCNKCDCMTNATTGAMNARLGMHELCLGAWCVIDSNTEWRGQGVLPGAHNLLEIRCSSTKTGQTSVLERISSYECKEH
jgi:hypothetical protein